MIDYSKYTKVGRGAYTDIMCNECGKLITRKVYRSVLERQNGEVYCNGTCATKHTNNLGLRYKETVKESRQEAYEIDLGNFRPTAPKSCRDNFMVINCTECTLKECKEVIADRADKKRYQWLYRDLKQQLVV